MSGLSEALRPEEYDVASGVIGDAMAARNEAAFASWELMQLVQQARAEDALPQDVRKGNEAFAAIYDQYYDAVFNNILRRVNFDTALAEELASETFLRAFKSAGTFRWQGKDIGAWLHTISVRLVIDHYGRAETRLTAPAFGEDALNQWPDASQLGYPEAESLKLRQRQELLDAVRQLSPDQQKVIVLRYFEEFSIEETAKHMDRDAEAIKSLTYRAVRALRKAMYTKKVILPPAPSEPVQPAVQEPAPKPEPQPVGSDWEEPSLLNVHAWQKPASAYRTDHPILPAERIKELTAQVKAAKAAKDLLALGDTQGSEVAELQATADRGARAKQLITLHNLRFAMSVALRYRDTHAEMDDLIQVANLGLLRMAGRVDPHKNDEHKQGAFTTLGHYYVNGSILRYLENERRTTRALSNDGHASALLRRSYEEARRLGSDVSYEQVGEWLGYPAAVTNRLLGGLAASRVLSLDANLHPGEASLSNIANKIEDPTASAEFARVEHTMLAGSVWRLLAKHLPEREYLILRAHYVEEKTHADLATELGVSRQRVGELLGSAHANSRKVLDGEIDTISVRRKRGKSKPKDGARTFFKKVGMQVAEDADLGALRAQLSDIFTSLGLSPIELKIARLRYGLGTEGGNGLSQQETAKRLGLSRGYVSLIDPKIQRLARTHLGL